MAERAALTGVRVIDLTTLLPGPYCTQVLADLGAEVIKVERPDGGDPARQLVPATFAAVNRGKQSVTLDLREQADRERLYSLMPTADVFIEGFRPGVAARLGVSYSDVATLNRWLIYCSLSGYGQTGPARDLPGHDLNYLGVAGALDATPEPEAPRHLASVPMADLAGALFAANAILAALLRRALDPSHPGAYIDISLAGSALALMSGRLGEAARLGDSVAAALLRGGGYRAYLGSDRQAFTVACIEDAFWRRMCEAIGRGDLGEAPKWATFAQRTAGADELDRILAAEFERRPRDEWLTLLRAADVPVAVVNAPSEVERDPFVRASGLLVADELDGLPVRSVRFPAHMPGLAFSPGSPDTRRAPALGEQNDRLFGTEERASAATQEYGGGNP